MKQSVRCLKQAWGLVLRVYPITLARLGLGLVFMLGTVLYVGAAGRLVWVVAQAVPWLGLGLLIAAIIGLVHLYARSQRCMLARVKAAQIAVMARMIEGETPPEHTGLLSWGRQLVRERWGDSDALCRGSQVVAGSVCGFSGLVYTLSSWLPQETPKVALYLLGRMVNRSVGSVNEAILARTFWRSQDTVWANARDGVVLYALVWRALLTNALALALLSAIPAAVIMLLLPAPLGVWLSSVSPVASAAGMAVGLLFACTIKSSLADSVSMAAMMVAYRDAVDGLEPDAILKSRLAYVSKFDELTRLAEEQAVPVANGSSLRLEGREVIGY